MLNRENRLKKNKQFKYIYKNGDGVRSGLVTLVYIKNRVKPFKFGFSVGSNVGKSVVRNKIKRRMKSILEGLIKDIDRRYNYIFVAKEGIEDVSYDDIKKDMCSCIKKAGLFNENSN